MCISLPFDISKPSHLVTVPFQSLFFSYTRLALPWSLLVGVVRITYLNVCIGWNYLNYWWMTFDLKWHNKITISIGWSTWAMPHYSPLIAISTACVGGTNLCYSLLLEVLVVCSSCAHLVLRGAKLSVGKKRRRKEVSEEMSINVPIITCKFCMYFIVCV